MLNRSGLEPPLEALLAGARTALSLHGMSLGELCIVLTTDEEIRDLNAKHRGIDEATDVLTFPPSEPARLAGALGDLVIAVPFAGRQAEHRGVALDVELGYLAIHGALHLAGFDDESDVDRRAMQLEMARIAGLAGLPQDPDWTTLTVSEAMA
ncbi:MAG: rRNA maturation RNase YbeY [Armatimonadetes bacterium]|nr:rRNA maturation RNase YbeY [Armatimonadota bacterium]